MKKFYTHEVYVQKDTKEWAKKFYSFSAAEDYYNKIKRPYNYKCLRSIIFGITIFDSE